MHSSMCSYTDTDNQQIPMIQQGHSGFSALTTDVKKVFDSNSTAVYEATLHSFLLTLHINYNWMNTEWIQSVQWQNFNVQHLKVEAVDIMKNWSPNNFYW